MSTFPTSADDVEVNPNAPASEPVEPGTNGEWPTDADNPVPVGTEDKSGSLPTLPEVPSPAQE